MCLLNSYLGLSKIPLFSERKDNFLKYKINIFFIKNSMILFDSKNEAFKLPFKAFFIQLKKAAALKKQTAFKLKKMVLWQYCRI